MNILEKRTVSLVHFNAFSHVRKELFACMCVCSFTQSYLTLCNPLDCRTPGSCIHGIFSDKNTGVGCQFLLQGINPMEGSNSHLLSPARAGRFFTTTAREAPFFPSPTHSYTSRSRIMYPGCKFAHKRTCVKKTSFLYSTLTLSLLLF